MAVLAGILVAAAIQADNITVSGDLATGAAPAGGAGLASTPLSGALASPGVSPEPQIPLAGAETIATEWWDKAIVLPPSRSLGLVGSEQTFSVEVWNTYRRTQWRITAATVSGVGGLQLSGVTLPARLAPLGSQTFTATAPEAGSATISNTATFSVAQDRAGGAVQFSPALTVTGLRITPFPFDPDWTRAVRERIEYRTNILTARTGAEQRIRLRMKPRRGLSFDLSHLDAAEQQAADTMLWKRQGDVFGVPFWQDAVQYSGTLAAGATSIAIDTTNRLFALAPMVMIWTGYKTAEIQTIESVGSSLVTCSALSGTYVNPRIIPVFPGRLPPSAERSHLTSNVTQHEVRFACEVGVDDPRPAPATPTQVYGYDVLEAMPNWEAPKSRARRLLQTFDNGMGPVLVRDRGNVSFQGQDFRWFLDGRAQVQAFRDFLDRRAGSLVPFWVPTWREDLTLSQAASSSDAGIQVVGCEYTDRMFPDHARRYLAIRTPAGGWIYRRVTSASEGVGVETLTLDDTVGVNLPAGTRVSFLVLCRLEDDAAEIEWSTGAFAQASTSFAEIPQEVA